MRSLKMAMIDDHNLFVRGFLMLLENCFREFQFEVLIATDDEEAFITILNTEKIEIAIVDLNLNNADGLTIISKLKQMQPDCKILVISMTTDPKIVRDAFKQGADGYLSKYSEPEDIEVAVDEILKGSIYLGPGIRATQLDPKSTEKFQSVTSLNRFNAKKILTKRELEILEKIIQGKSSKLIASELFISRETVNVHRRNLMKKLGVSTSVSLVKIAADLSLL